MIGPNGAGKTTLINTIMNAPPARSGRILFKGADITRSRTYRVARRGIRRSFQLAGGFAEFTVKEALTLGLLESASRFPYGVVVPLGRRAEVVSRARSLLEEHGLQSVEDVLVSELSYGEQRQLDVVTALAASADLVLLDEPSAGLTADEVSVVTELIRERADVAVIVIDHDLECVFGVSDRVALLDRGSIVAQDSAEGMRDSEIVRSVYLGER